MTSACNLNCRHCYAADWFSDGTSLDLETTLSAIHQSRALGCLKVTFTGGEPFVAQATAPAMTACLDLGLRVEVETNGLLLHKVLPKLGGYLDRIEFAVSYDGDVLRGPRVSERVRENITLLASLHCDLKLQTVLTELNLDEADAIFGFSEQLGIPNRVFLAHSPNGNAVGLPLFPVASWLRTLRRLRSRYSHLIIELPDVFSGGTQKKCGWGVHRCEIMPNGDVTSCGPIAFNHREYIAGNVRARPLAEIWDEVHFASIRALTQAHFEGFCARCPWFSTCIGACRAIAYATEGTLLAAHPFCVAFYREVEAGSIEPELLDAVPLGRQWFETVRSQRHVPAGDSLGELVQRQHVSARSQASH